MNVFALESKRDFIGLRYKVYTVKMMSYVLLFILCVCVLIFHPPLQGANPSSFLFQSLPFSKSTPKPHGSRRLTEEDLLV